MNSNTKITILHLIHRECKKLIDATGLKVLDSKLTLQVNKDNPVLVIRIEMPFPKDELRWMVYRPSGFYQVASMVVKDDYIIVSIRLDSANADAQKIGNTARRIIRGYCKQFKNYKVKKEYEKFGEANYLVYSIPFKNFEDKIADNTEALASLI